MRCPSRPCHQHIPMFTFVYTLGASLDPMMLWEFYRTQTCDQQMVAALCTNPKWSLEALTFHLSCWTTSNNDSTITVHFCWQGPEVSWQFGIFPPVFLERNSEWKTQFCLLVTEPKKSLCALRLASGHCKAETSDLHIAVSNLFARWWPCDISICGFQRVIATHTATLVRSPPWDLWVLGKLNTRVVKFSIMARRSLDPMNKTWSKYLPIAEYKDLFVCL